MHLKAFSLSRLQEMTGIQTTAISRIFQGKGISENTIKRFAVALGVSKVEAYRQIEEVRRLKANEKAS